MDLLRRTVCKGASEDELRMFFHQCNKTGLDALSRQIYAVKRYDGREKREVMAFQVSIDGFRLIASRTGKYAGQIGPYWCGSDGKWVDVWLSEKPPAAAKVAVLHADFREPLWAVARFAAYAQTTRDGGLNTFWRRMPDAMIAKVAESLALRRAFPQELSGLYTGAEMGHTVYESDLHEPDAAEQLSGLPAPEPEEIPGPPRAELATAPQPGGGAHLDLSETSTPTPDEIKRIYDGLARLEREEPNACQFASDGKKWHVGDLSRREAIKLLAMLEGPA